MSNLVTGVFDTMKDAEPAIDWLRGNGIPDGQITVFRRHEHDGAAGNTGSDVAAQHADAGDAGKGALTGAGIGAGVGALFGLAAAAIPGVGPFIAAGAFAHTLGITGGAALSGAIVGGTSGGIASALTHYGLNEAEANHYGGEIERGGIFVGANLEGTNVSRDAAIEAFRRFHGRFSPEPATARR